jgi:hypothetical protein
LYHFQLQDYYFRGFGSNFRIQAGFPARSINQQIQKNKLQFDVIVAMEKESGMNCRRQVNRAKILREEGYPYAPPSNHLEFVKIS